jgi:hypothetical protein
VSVIAGLPPATGMLRHRSFASGFVGAMALLGLYLTVISIAQGATHAFEQLAADAPFVGLIAAGFGTQVALFVELRAVDRRHRAAAAVTAAGTGTSVAAMLAAALTTWWTSCPSSGSQPPPCSSTSTRRPCSSSASR